MNAPAQNTDGAEFDQRVILEALGVSMIFPGTIALEKADFAVRRAAVTALGKR